MGPYRGYEEIIDPSRAEARMKRGTSRSLNIINEHLAKELLDATIIMI